MEKFYLEIPSLKRKDDITNYVNEFVEYNSELNGMGPLMLMTEGYSFEEALDFCLKAKDNDFSRSINRIPSETFLLIRYNDNKIVGSINIRFNLNEEELKYVGHIGYGIRPTERRKGYNKINLYLGFIKAKSMGLDDVILSCESDNIASDKTLKSFNGKLVRSEKDPYDGLLTNVYSFNVSEAINNYKNIYEQYIK